MYLYKRLKVFLGGADGNQGIGITNCSYRSNISIAAQLWALKYDFKDDIVGESDSSAPEYDCSRWKMLWEGCVKPHAEGGSIIALEEKIKIRKESTRRFFICTDTQTYKDIKTGPSFSGGDKASENEDILTQPESALQSTFGASLISQ